MKKVFFLFFLIIFCALSAQDLTSNKGEQILPESGDWSVGISAHPFLNYFSNIFTSSDDDKDLMVPSFGDDLYFSMKRFVSDDKAIRYTLGANFDTSEETWSMGIGYGVENRKGSTRLQGMWGYNGFIGIGENFDSNNWLSIPTIIFEDGYNMNVSTSLFIGCEYFFIPKIAIGAEYHYGLRMQITDDQTTFYIGNNASNTIIKINFYF